MRRGSLSSLEEVPEDATPGVRYFQAYLLYKDKGRPDMKRAALRGRHSSGL